MAVILGERTNADSATEHKGPWAVVPWRTIVASTLVVASFIGLVIVLIAVQRVVAWIVIAGFFAIVLAPPVRIVQRRVGGHRGIATAIVMFSTLAVVVGAVALFVLPIRSQILQSASDLPGTVRDAAQGKGPVGNIVTRLNIDSYVRNNQDSLQRWADDVSGSSVSIAQSVLGGVLATVTVFVVAFLFLTQAGAMGRTLVEVVPLRRRDMVRRMAADTSAAVSGYMVGNLIISLVAGTTAFICLLSLGVPNAAVLAIWVAFADLIPLVGATLGAAVAVLAAFLHNPTAGIISLIFFVIYQQFENSILQTNVMSRTVKVNPLIVLLSVVLGVELFGIAGALLALPVAGSVQVVVGEIWREFHREQLVLPSDYEHGPSS